MYEPDRGYVNWLKKRFSRVYGLKNESIEGFQSFGENKTVHATSFSGKKTAPRASGTWQKPARTQYADRGKTLSRTILNPA
jgi:hypothetical protein